MEMVFAWVAPAATMIAAMMTAANLGSRVTGWGFAVFVAGSLAWFAVGLSSGQTNLVLTNGFLTIVNLVGVWRWLGRQAKYDDGGKVAASRSARAHVPTLFSSASLIGRAVISDDGEKLGTIVDAMASCAGAKFAYVVIAKGGVVGVGEQLHAVDPELLTFSHDKVLAKLTAAQLSALPILEPDHWPESLSSAAMPSPIGTVTA